MPDNLAYRQSSEAPSTVFEITQVEDLKKAGGTLHFADGTFVSVDKKWFAANQPQEGGYYVSYPTATTYWTPAAYEAYAGH